jgi:hypothetical protein
MEPGADMVFHYISTALGSVVSILIVILLKKLGRIDKIQETLNQHILEFAKIIGTFVTAPSCVEIRKQCFEMNKTLIATPLQKAIDEQGMESDERWLQYEQEAEQLWLAVRSHIHTDKGVVVDVSRRISK